MLIITDAINVGLNCDELFDNFGKLQPKEIFSKRLQKSKPKYTRIVKINV